MSHRVVGDAMHQLLTTGFNSIISHILDYGDGLLNGGYFSWTESNAAAVAASGGTEAAAGSSSGGDGGVPPMNELAVHIWNADNHQLTYGVLGAAISALSEYMQSYGWGAATFQIWDGPNEVGFGMIG